MPFSEPERPVEILMIEDNPGDARLAREALKEGKILNTLHVMKDGREGLDFLYRRGRYLNVPKPDIILLDLNLPGLDGRQVLQEIKSNDSLKLIPVIVLTSSAAEEDILKSYDLHANCYIVKPVDFEKFTQIVKQLEDFWFSVVKLPTS
jgi:CheY-like chemotaxis protein